MNVVSIDRLCNARVGNSSIALDPLNPGHFRKEWHDCLKNKFTVCRKLFRSSNSFPVADLDASASDPVSDGWSLCAVYEWVWKRESVRLRIRSLGGGSSGSRRGSGLMGGDGLHVVAG